MKTGLGLYRKYRMLYAYLNLFRFGLRKVFLGFDVANIFIQRVDKYSNQLILRQYGATIGDGCNIETGQVFHNCRDYSNLFIGKNCHVGKNCFFDLKERVVINDNVVVSMKCSFITHIDMYRSVLKELYPTAKNAVIIEKDVYLGAGGTVLMGSVLGEGSIVAAGAVVNSNIESFTIVAGIPAKPVKKLGTFPK